jgi:ATP-dependent exoDNAse (exonuclease V) beta subunit
VGDVKQAIFAWRGGDPRLFREIFNHYNAAAPGTIAERRLDASYRSGPAVLAMVNQVFGDTGALQAGVPEATAAAWAREWRPHATARPERGGWAELRHAPDEAGRMAETLAILRETDALARGLDVAVLVKQNDQAAAFAEYLRREGGLPAIAESDRHVATDNPLTVAFLALLRAAAHPGDRLAQEHLNMTPLVALLAHEGCAGADALTRRLLGEIHADGFAATLERWRRALAAAMKLDDFSLERGRMLVDAAAKFDESGSRDVAEFLEYAERYTVRDAEAAGVVRVMTIHKSKGLGFDLVVLPDLEGKTLAARRDGLAVRRGSDRAVEWVLDLPAKFLVEHEPVLAAYLAEAEAEAAYENLCLLYVAMTRAKRAMYVITEPVAAKSTSRNFPRLLRDTLGEQWSEGDAQWYEKIARPVVAVETAVPPAAADEPVSPAARAVRRPARTPSEPVGHAVDGARLFDLKDVRATAAEHGVAVHAALAEIEWAGEIAQLLAVEWGKAGGPRAEAAACVHAAELAEVWTRPGASGGAEVWRERPFEIVLDGEWISGVVDRVVLERGVDGRARRATEYDFKTDRVEPGADLHAAAARHAAQCEIYRRAVATLAQLAPAAVGCEVVFTRVRRRVAMGN